MNAKTEEIKEISLDDNRRFSYTIKQVETTNSLGAVVAILDEYSIASSSRAKYRLYKTKEGYWYENGAITTELNNAVKVALKIAIDSNQ